MRQEFRRLRAVVWEAEVLKAGVSEAEGTSFRG